MKTIAANQSAPANSRQKMRGAGPVVCCGHHRDRCLFGHPHIWATYYHEGKLVRTPDTDACHRCGGICTAEEAAK